MAHLPDYTARLIYIKTRVTTCRCRPGRINTGDTHDFPDLGKPYGDRWFEFIEYAAPDPKALGELFVTMGFTAIARHRTKDVTLFRQGDVNFIINAEKDSFAQKFARKHGPSVCAFAFRVKDANAAYKRALELGAWGFDKTGPMELNIPAIKGIGDSLIYFVDRWHGKDGAQPGAIGNISIYDADFVAIPGVESNPVGLGLTYIDHLTHNVHRGRMKEWADFYETLFNFREIRYFDIAGKHTGLKSKAMTSPCGKIRIPINESSDDKSQIAEYLDLYQGEGVQHRHGHGRCVCDRQRHESKWRGVPGHDRHLLRSG
jgi:4-hydroxyphenylpyruvate dioxygenase